MPGGALITAPMVEAAGRPLGVCDRDKTLINYWFRHIWENSWPLNPGIVLAATYSGYSVLEICAFQLPLLVLVTAAGYGFFVRGLRFEGPLKAPEGLVSRGRAVRRFLQEIAPIWLVVLIYVILRLGTQAALAALDDGSAAHRALEAVPSTAALVAGIVLTTLYTWARNRMGLRQIGRVLWQRDMADNLVIAVGIIVFAGVLQGSRAADQVALEFQEHDIPVWLVAMVLPFAVGAITGITMNMVALTYPVILAALAAPELRPLGMAYLVLAFACGYAGILITPIHICMVQSNHFFRLNATDTLRELALPCLSLIAGGVLLFLLYAYLASLGVGPGAHTYALAGG
jgi:hypothetical protein